MIESVIDASLYWILISIIWSLDLAGVDTASS